MNKMKKFRIAVVALILVSATVLTGFRGVSTGDNFKVRTDKSSLKWKAYKTGGMHNGTVDIKEGSMTLDGILITSGEFVVDMTSIKVLDTESGKLHNHLHSKDFFNTAAFPEAKLTVTGSTKLDDKDIDVQGNLTIVGKSNPITFTAKIAAHTNDVIIYNANVKIDRTKYGIDYRSSLGDAFIDDNFDLEIKLVGVRE